MIKDLKTAVEDWTQGTVPGGFSFRSGYYAGRPPSRGDIATETLEGIYNGLKSEVGPAAATTFVRFVNFIDDMSASSFIVAFERFANSEFTEPHVRQDKSDRSRIDGHGDAALPQAFGLMAERLANPQTESDIRRKSDEVKFEFLMNHLKEIPQAEQRQMRSFY